MDRLDELTVFVTIVEAGSLAGAARRLRRSAPAVTRALASLEARIGARLLQRTTRRVSPTETGRKLADRARRVLAEIEEMVLAFGEEAATLTGALRITAPVVFGRLHITPLVADFLGTHPGVQVALTLSDRYLDLVEEGFDIALRIGRLRDSGLIVRRVGQVRRLVVASPHYVAARGTPETPDDLVRHEIIYTSERPGPVEWRFRQSGGERGLRLSPRLLVNQVDAAHLAARQGRGVAAALSYQVADDLAAGRLVPLLADFELPPVPVQLVMPSVQLLPARVRVFFDDATRALARLAVLREGWSLLVSTLPSP